MTNDKSKNKQESGSYPMAADHQLGSIIPRRRALAIGGGLLVALATGCAFSDTQPKAAGDAADEAVDDSPTDKTPEHNNQQGIELVEESAMSTLILACDILEADEAHTKDNSGNGRTLRQLYNRPDVAEDTDDTPGGPIPVVEVNYTKDTEEDGGQQRLTVSINADPGNEEDTSAKLEDSLFVRIRLSSDNAFTRTDELTPQVLRDFMAEFLEKQPQSETETSPDTFITELEAASSKGSGLRSGAKGATFDAAALPHGPGFTISFNEERLISPEDSAEDSNYPKSLMQGQKVVEDAIAGLTPRGVR